MGPLCGERAPAHVAEEEEEERPARYFTVRTTTTARVRQVCELWVFSVRCNFMADPAEQPSGAARRRRERRLRSTLRHEQQTVRKALAAALHHSAGPKEKVEMQQNHAPRGQKTAARAREVEEHDTHAGLRAQKTPPQGRRPGTLAEPGPQRSDRSPAALLRGSSFSRFGVAGWWRRHGRRYGRLPPLCCAFGEDGRGGGGVEEERGGAEGRREEEVEARKRAKALKGWDEEALWQLNRRVQAGSTLSSAEYAAWYCWDGGVSSSSSASGLKKKRKKKRRKRRPTAWRRSSHVPRRLPGRSPSCSMYVTLPAVLSLVSSVTTYLAVTCLGLVLPEVTLFSALLGLTVDTCRLRWFFEPVYLAATCSVLVLLEVYRFIGFYGR